MTLSSFMLYHFKSLDMHQERFQKKKEFNPGHTGLCNKELDDLMVAFESWSSHCALTYDLGLVLRLSNVVTWRESAG